MPSINFEVQHTHNNRIKHRFGYSACTGQRYVAKIVHSLALIVAQFQPRAAAVYAGVKPNQNLASTSEFLWRILMMFIKSDGSVV